MNWHAVSDYFARVRARVWRGWCIAVFDYDPGVSGAVMWNVESLVALGKAREAAESRVRVLENALLSAQFVADRISSDVNAALYRDGDADEPAHDPEDDYVSVASLFGNRGGAP